MKRVSFFAAVLVLSTTLSVLAEPPPTPPGLRPTPPPGSPPPGSLPGVSAPAWLNERIRDGKYHVLNCISNRRQGSTTRYEIDVYAKQAGRRAVVITNERKEGSPRPFGEPTGVATISPLAHEAGAAEERFTAPGFTLVLDKRMPLSPQRYSGTLAYRPEGKPAVDEALTCHAYDRFAEGAIVDVEANCAEKEPAQPPAQPAPGRPIRPTPGGLFAERLSLIISSSGATRIAEITRGGLGFSPQRQVRVARTDHGDAQVYEGAGLRLSIDLVRKENGGTYPARATVNVHEFNAGQTRYVDKTAEMSCRLFDYLPPDARALNVLMTGRGPAADRDGVTRLTNAVGTFERAGIIRVTRRGPGGIEGGVSFCAELAPGQNHAALRQVFATLRNVQYNRQTTSLNLDPLERCARQ